MAAGLLLLLLLLVVTGGTAEGLLPGSGGDADTLRLGAPHWASQLGWAPDVNMCNDDTTWATFRIAAANWSMSDCSSGILQNETIL